MQLLKYYKIIVKGNDKGGVLYAPASWPFPIACDGEDVKDWQALVVELKDGPYRNFNMCVGFANMVSEAFRNVLLSVLGENEDLEFLPVKAVSKEYGDRTYYIMHFKKVFDVIDTENTKYVPGTDAVIKLWVDYDKVKDLKIFNSRPYINDVIVSPEVRKSIKKAKLDDGIEFLPIYCEHGV